MRALPVEERVRGAIRSVDVGVVTPAECRETSRQLSGGSCLRSRRSRGALEGKKGETNCQRHTVDDATARTRHHLYSTLLALTAEQGSSDQSGVPKQSEEGATVHRHPQLFLHSSVTNNGRSIRRLGALGSAPTGT